MSPQRACLACSRPAVPGGSRCAEHGGNRSGWAKTKAKDPARAAFYASGGWKRMRALQLAREPTCAVCGAPATHADHVENIAGGGAWDGPLQSLCEKHHQAKTLAESHRGMKRAATLRRVK